MNGFFFHTVYHSSLLALYLLPWMKQQNFVSILAYDFTNDTIHLYLPSYYNKNVDLLMWYACRKKSTDTVSGWWKTNSIIIL